MHTTENKMNTNCTCMCHIVLSVYVILWWLEPEWWQCVRRQMLDICKVIFLVVYS